MLLMCLRGVSFISGTNFRLNLLSTFTCFYTSAKTIGYHRYVINLPVSNDGLLYYVWVTDRYATLLSWQIKVLLPTTTVVQYSLKCSTTNILHKKCDGWQKRSAGHRFLGIRFRLIYYCCRSSKSNLEQQYCLKCDFLLRQHRCVQPWNSRESMLVQHKGENTRIVQYG